MEECYFNGLSIDEAVSFINQMVQCYKNLEALFYIGTSKLKVEKLSIIVHTIFLGLGKPQHAQKARRTTYQGCVQNLAISVTLWQTRVSF